MRLRPLVIIIAESRMTRRLIVTTVNRTVSPQLRETFSLRKSFYPFRRTAAKLDKLIDSSKQAR